MEGKPPETHTYFANSDGATYGWWIERTPTDVVVNVVSTAGVVAAGIPSNMGSVGRPMLLVLTLTAANELQLRVNGTLFVSAALGANTYIPAPGGSRATVGIRSDLANSARALIAGLAYATPAIDENLYAVQWAACQSSRDLVDHPARYGNFMPAYTNLWSGRRGNNGLGEGTPFAPAVPFRAAHPVWQDEHGLVPLERVGTLFIATILDTP